MLFNSQVMPNFRRDFDTKKTLDTEGAYFLLKNGLYHPAILNNRLAIFAIFFCKICKICKK